MQEALLGYPLHAFLAIGHLAEAEAELLEKHPDLASTIRAERIQYLEGLERGVGENDEITIKPQYHIDIIQLVQQLVSREILEGEKIEEKEK
jgi:hypothetical protein